MCHEGTIMTTQSQSSKLADSLARERERLYVSTDGKRTFARDESLPPLPVPDLEKTIERYLDSVAPHATPENYEKTKRICQDFVKGRGAHLNKLLLERSKTERNWLDAWWRDIAYLRGRAPLIPQSNMVGTFGLFEYAQRYSGPRSEYVAKGLSHYMQFWYLIRTERLKQQTFRDIAWSMDQFRRAFNTVRVPQQEVDDLQTFFHTQEEKFDVPTNMIVLCRGHIFSIEMCDSRKVPLTAAEIAIGIEKIEKYCSTQPRGKGVGALTCQEREQWAIDRQHLIDLSKENREKLRVIEESLMVCVLDEASPATRTDVISESLKGRCVDRWADKGEQVIFFSNFTVGSSSDHTPVDGMVPICLSHWAHLSTLIDDLNQQSMGPVRPANLKEPVYIDFQLDDELEMSLVRARAEYEKVAASIEVHVSEFKGYGKDFLKTTQIHPEAFFQIVLQAAYIRLYNKPASTYCTASTRGFYKGRTETCRSCSQEVVDFSKALIAKKPAAELGPLLAKAIMKFNITMLECIHAQGCDRHLMGLAILAWLETGGENMPEIFTDPSFELSGGNGKFVLSTSLNGFTPLIGGVVPMVENGYGCFYSFEKDQIIINVICYKDHGAYAGKFYQAIVDTLEDMRPLLSQSRL